MYKCADCGRTFKTKPFICPSCQGTDFTEDASADQIIKNNSKKSANAKATIRDLKSTYNQNDFKVIKTTDFKDLNSILSDKKGLLESQVVLLSANSGTGKTTLLTQMCNNEDDVFISTEETFNQVKSRFERCNPNSKAKIVNTTDEFEIYDVVSNPDFKFVCIDSLNMIGGGDYVVAYAKLAQIAINITRLIKQTKKCCIIVSQVTRNGNTVGLNTVPHAVDTLIDMTRSSISDTIFTVSSKNRFGPVGDLALFRHNANGLEEIENTKMEASVGTSCFYQVIGSKRIPFNVQCLITEAVDLHPIRKAMGINPQNMYIWLAIISSNYRGFTVSNKDVYMQTSNGIPLQPGNDLACINAILSAYTGKVININPDDLSGICNLNGSISGNKRFTNVNELIDIYRRK